MKKLMMLMCVLGLATMAFAQTGATAESESQNAAVADQKRVVFEKAQSELDEADARFDVLIRYNKNFTVTLGSVMKAHYELADALRNNNMDDAAGYDEINDKYMTLSKKVSRLNYAPLIKKTWDILDHYYPVQTNGIITLRPLTNLFPESAQKKAEARLAVKEVKRSAQTEIEKEVSRVELQKQAKDEQAEVYAQFQILIKHNKNFKVSLNKVLQAHKALIKALEENDISEEAGCDAVFDKYSELIDHVVALNYNPLIRKTLDILDHYYYSYEQKDLYLRTLGQLLLKQKLENMRERLEELEQELSRPVADSVTALPEYHNSEMVTRPGYEQGPREIPEHQLLERAVSPNKQIDSFPSDIHSAYN